jgi:hypothetical protein
MPIDRIGTDGIENGAVVPADLSTGGPSWDSSGNLSFNSGYGSTAVAYGCRAWVNFNGTGTVAIRASGNVSSITDNGTGDYTVNFTTAMPDANYTITAATGGNGNTPVAGAFASQVDLGLLSGYTTTSARIYVAKQYSPYTVTDTVQVCISIFR